jgi:serine/threonine-protein kinase
MTSNTGDLTGKTLGTCVLERLLGHGGMGVVYLAEQTRPARRVAVKIMLPQFAPSSEIYQEFLARFRREADVIARLEHIHIMPIYEYGEQDGLAYLVMPYLTGGSLRDILARRGRLPLSEVLTYIEQAASALDYAHKHGVIHRDLKPANFLLHADGRLVLADFGIARILDNDVNAFQTLTATGSMVGTPEYMAPEMARGEAIDYRADIYELGIVLFQLLSGHAPFTGNTPYAVAVKHLQDPLPLLHPVNPSIPTEVDAVIQKATAKQRENRYTSAQELARALRQAAAPLTTTRSEEDLEQSIPPTQLSAPLVDSTIRAGETPAALIPPPPPVMQSFPNNGMRDNAAQAQTYTTPPAYPSPTPHPTPGRRPPWWIFIGILLVLILFVGGIQIGLQLNRSSASTTPTPAATTATKDTPTTKTGTTAATGQATSTATTPPTTLPVGTLLYSTTSPGQHCDTHGGTWNDYNGVQIDCLNSAVRISSTAQVANLQGTFLTQLPDQVYPANYVVQVQLQQEQSSQSDFGIYFRNQPGKQQGVYTFLIHPDGTWSANVYNNSTGNPTKLTGGNFGDVYAPITLAVIVNGHQFTFYANGTMLGKISDASYNNGTAGIVVDQGVRVVASNFALYAPAS